MTKWRGAQATVASFSAVAMAVMLFGFGATSSANAANALAQPEYGGTMTILENSANIGAWAQGLDPDTNLYTTTDEPYEDAIFGQLVEQSAKGQPEPDLATGWTFLDGDRTVKLFLRHGVTFSDGTPFNAAAVAWNWRRQVKADGPKLLSTFPMASVTTQGQYTVVLHMTKPFSPLITALTDTSPDWIASPTASRKMGETAFSLQPVGAGPFEVVSDTQNSELVLKKNPHYWQKGRPYLDGLTFKSVGNDQSAYEALKAGGAQVAQDVTTLSVVQTAQKDSTLHVVVNPGGGAAALQLNTSIAPFNDIRAREAIYYALDPQALNKVIAGGQAVVEETGDGPASLFPYGKIPGYRTYDPAKAKALVQQLGGLSFTITGSSGAPQLTEAETSEFEAVGMHVQITTVDLAQLVEEFEKNSWQITGGGAGGLDPAIGAGEMAWRVISNAPYTGIHNAQLDKLVNEGTTTTNRAGRAKIYKQIYQIISKKAYLPFLYATPTYNITAKNVHGLGISSPVYNLYYLNWPDAWMSK